LKRQVVNSNQLEISSIKPATLLANEAECLAIENFTLKSFCQDNPHVAKAFSQSPDQTEFSRLFKEQIKDGLENIIIANQTRANSGFVIIARDLRSANKPIIGFLMGVRNGVQLPSEAYNKKVFTSTCGLSKTMEDAFGPVMNTYNLPKLSQHDNLFMLCMTAVHPEHRRIGIASGMIKCLNKTLEQTHYDGCFTIATSQAARTLVEKVQPKQRKIFLETASICFIGFAFDKEDQPGLQALEDIYNNCRVMPLVANQIRAAGGSPMMAKTQDPVPPTTTLAPSKISKF
jgi:ribosomal protein S18 acetylase RimI-like enzyme